MKKNLVNLNLSVFTNLLSKFLNIILTFFLIYSSSLYINKSDISFWLSIVSILAYISFFEFGLSNSLAKSQSGHSSFKINNLFICSIHLIFILITIFFLIIKFNFSLIFIEKNIFNGNSFFLNILLIGLSLTVINICFEKLMIALRKAYIFYISQILFFILILNFVFLYPPNDIDKFLIITLFTFLFPSFFVLIFYLKNKSGLFTIQKISKYFEVFKQSFNIWLVGLIYILLISSDLFFMLLFFGPSDIFQFNLYLRIFQILVIPPIFLVNNSWGIFSSLYSKKHTDDLLFLLKRIFLYSFIYFALMIPLLFFCLPGLIKIIYPPGMLFDLNYFFMFSIRSISEFMIFLFIIFISATCQNKRFILVSFLIATFFFLTKFISMSFIPYVFVIGFHAAIFFILISIFFLKSIRTLDIKGSIGLH